MTTVEKQMERMDAIGDELLANCEECGAPISVRFALCSDCELELHISSAPVLEERGRDFQRD